MEATPGGIEGVDFEGKVLVTVGLRGIKILLTRSGRRREVTDVEVMLQIVSITAGRCFEWGGKREAVRLRW